MVVMLRSLSVPARLAVGYAQGRYDAANSTYYVTEKDSHTWVEVYFPKYGWIEFEPTASQPQVIRPTPQPTAAPVTPEPDSGGLGGTRTPRDRTPDEEDFDRGFGGGVRLSRPFGGFFDSWMGPAGLAGLIIALAFVMVWARERRRSGGAKRAIRGFGSWLGVIGLVEIVVVVIFLVLWGLGRLGLGRLGEIGVALGPWIAVLAIVEVLVVIVLLAMRVFERQGLRGMSATAQVYARLLRFANWLNVRWKESQTPHERGDVFTRAAPEAGEFIEQIVDNYTREQYSPAPPDATHAEQTWQATSPLLWMAGLRHRIAALRLRWRDFTIWRDALSRRMNDQFG
jgi:hypothetical protein